MGRSAGEEVNQSDSKDTWRTGWAAVLSTKTRRKGCDLFRVPYITVPSAAQHCVVGLTTSIVPYMRTVRGEGRGGRKGREEKGKRKRKGVNSKYKFF